MSGPMTGRHVGAKLAGLMHDARVAAASKIIPAEVAHRAEYHTALMEQIEQDLAPTFRTMFADIVEHPDCPPQARAYLEPLLHPEHQGQFILTVIGLLGLGLAGPAAAAAGWTQRLQNLSKASHGDLPLTPEQAAEGVLKGQLEHGYAAAQAREAGTHADTFEALIALTGDPPGPQQLAEALRRGYIDEARFAHGIRESRMRDEWIDVMTKLRFAPPGVGEVLAGAVQNHLSEADARKKLSEAGIDDSNYSWLFETHGRPPGIQELVQLWRRDAVSQQVVEQAVRESDIKDKYVPAILQFKKHVLPQRTVVSGLRQGAVDEATARQMLKAEGIEGADADMLVKEAHATRSQSIRDLSAGQVVQLYQDGLTSRADAQAHLVGLRYPDGDAAELLDLADAKRSAAVQSAAIRRVGTLFVGHHIDVSAASTQLDTLRVDPQQRDDLLRLWTIERTANVRRLTEAQMHKAFVDGIWDEATATAQLQTLGYSAEDAALLLKL